MKYCPGCEEEKPLLAFSPARRTQSGAYCRVCANARHLAYYHRNKEKYFAHNRKYEDRDVAKYLLKRAQERARKHDLPFTITKADVVVPVACPILGLVLQRGDGLVQDCSPTLDRILPELGYVPGNVVVISYRANRIKNDASLDELRALVAWMQSRCLTVAPADDSRVGVKMVKAAEAFAAHLEAQT